MPRVPLPMFTVKDDLEPLPSTDPSQALNVRVLPGGTILRTLSVSNPDADGWVQCWYEAYDSGLDREMQQRVMEIDL